jgi:xeroderma pigmentosum group C-complementing protein
MVTKSLAKPSKFEPPASDPYNSMSYVVAFEDDGSVRDVTRRYAKAFNAKTRKLRVESTRNGDSWWNAALQAYEKPFLEDRDELEISELTSKSAAEPMPRNIQDFKDHPIYALERHLHRNEVIFPKRVIGHVGLSKTTSKSDNLDPVYRRSDVHIVHSADKWYRLGRDVKVGEQPLKRVRPTRPKSGFTSDEEENEPEQTALYAEYQTELYQPPPAVQGRVPKNAYGNLDIYVPSMVPPGAVHVRRPEAARAARILGIDYADAVTGFDFKGRRGTAVIGGVVIACEYHEALEEVMRAMADEQHRAALEARSAEALRFWRLFLVKLRIAERVKEYAADDEENDDASVSDMSVDDAEEAGGGFFPDPDQPAYSPPQKAREQMLSTGEAEAIDTGKEDEHLGGGFFPHETVSSGADASNTGHDDDAFGGGFLPDEPVDEGPASNPPTGNSGQDGVSGGGFMLDRSVDFDPTSNTPAISQPSNPSRSKRARASNTPRYELIVIPKSTTVSEGRPDTIEHAAARELEGSSEKVPITVDSSTNGDSKSASVVDIMSRPTSPQKDLQSQPPQDSDSEIEKGSLLSEDPDDEDAVPDWLI